MSNREYTWVVESDQPDGRKQLALSCHQFTSETQASYLCNGELDAAQFLLSELADDPNAYARQHEIDTANEIIAKHQAKYQ